MAACALVLLLAGGCGQNRVSSGRVITVRGYADLDALVRRHPGWAGIAQYDLALLRLQHASVRLNVPNGDTSLSLLPAPDLQVPLLTPGSKAGQQARLENLKQSQVSRLRVRRAQSRAEQVFPLKEEWQREAEAQYIQSLKKAQAIYLRQLRLGEQEQDVQRLNLSLQIKALQNTIDGWKVSPPPAPILKQTQAELIRKQALLTELDAAQVQRSLEISRTRNASLALARAARAAYVETRTHEKLADLQAKDDVQIAAFASRLALQEQALMRGPQIKAAFMPPSGWLGTTALPKAIPGVLPLPGSVTRSQEQLLAAEARLRTQRARWLAFLYDDTRAAVLDAAQQQHWQVTFGKSGAGEALTEPLANLLTVKVWKA